MPKPAKTPRKRRRGPEKSYTPVEALRALATTQLQGTLDSDHVLVSADPAAAELLDCSGFGTRIFPAAAAEAQPPADGGAAEPQQQEPPPQQHFAWGRHVAVGALGPTLQVKLPAEVLIRMRILPGLALRTEGDLKQQPGEETEEQPSATTPVNIPAALLRRPDAATLQQSKAQRSNVGRRRGAGRGRYTGERVVEGPTPYALALEEAFFLAHAVGALRVGELSCQQLWAACLAAKPAFPQAYVPYHHFRSKGWLVRPGVNYGADYVLYNDHPSAAHSSFCVLTLTGPKAPELLSWADVEATNRVATQVSKRLIILRLQQEPSTADCSSPDCLATFMVEERLVKRWVAGSRSEDYLRAETFQDAC